MFGILTIALLGLASGAEVGEPDKLEALKPRSIGPAAMSGRITSIDVDPRDPDRIYAGSASGGLWRSDNQGTTWTPIFDDQDSASIGAVAVDPLNSDVIWVATGEANPRNSQSVGTGIYKSVDGGQSWQRLGLEKSEHLHRILIHPRRTDTVYVCATGPTWSDGEQRGVYKSSDGGQSWNRVLYVNQSTGCADLVMDPVNPDKLMAALWDHRRTPWDFRSGGPGSGLHVTYDGGATWSKRTHEDGLPEGDLGRIGLAIAKSRPEVAYALVEAKKSALFRSEDGGRSWEVVNDSRGIANRPFYYCDIRVDPANENRVFNIFSSVTISEDGGRNFENLVGFSSAHSDHHAFWIDAENPQYMIDGNDGGLAISRDGGKKWRFAENLPLGQFYHISVDEQTPYRVYGGLQDNGSFVGPSQVWEQGVGGGGILNSHWRMISFGDGFDVVADRADPRIAYSMSQGGNLYKVDLVTGNTKSIRPPDPPGEMLRFNWNAGIAADPFEEGTIYYGSQYLHRSRDRGESWETISGDLTTNDPEKQKQLDSGGLTYDVTGAENHTTIVAVAPSPVKQGVIWVGTDDGNVQLSSDGGKSWNNLTSNISGVPEATWVPHIEASKFEEGGAFVVFDDHRRGNWTPYAFKTSDYGQTWTSLATDDLRGFVYVIEQDPKVENLLFLGTEFHLYYSLDGGGSWNRWQHGYPTVPTRDLAIHPTQPDLVVGTFGRAIYIMDDITPLREMARQGREILDQPLHLFEVASAIQAEISAPPGELTPGDAAFRGENRPTGAIINYVFNAPQEEAAPAAEKVTSGSNGNGPAPQQGRRRAQRGQQRREAGSEGDGDENGKKEVKIEILDSDDQVVRTLPGPTEAGLNRVVWRLDRERVSLPSRGRRPNFFGRGGPPVLPGSYTVRASFGELQASRQVQVLADPRTDISQADRQAKSDMIDILNGHIESLNEAFERLEKAEEDMQRVDQMAEGVSDEKVENLRRVSRETSEKIERLTRKILPEPVQGIRRDPDTVPGKVSRASGYLQSSWDAPNDTERKAVAQAESAVNAFIAEVDAFFDKDWKAFQKAAKSADLKLFAKDRDQ